MHSIAEGMGGVGVAGSNTTRPPRSRGIHYLVKYTKRSHDCQDPVTNAHNRGSPVCRATDYCSPGSIWKLAACFLSWTLPEAIIATEGGGLIKSTGWLVYVALQLNLSKAIVRHLYSSCATSRCLFQCIVMAWNSAVVFVLMAAVAVFLSQSWKPLSRTLWPAFSWLKRPFVLAWQRACLNWNRLHCVRA